MSSKMMSSKNGFLFFDLLMTSRLSTKWKRVCHEDVKDDKTKIKTTKRDKKRWDNKR